MDQSRTAVSRPQFFGMFHRACHSPLRLNICTNLDPATEPIRPPFLGRQFREISFFSFSHDVIRTIDNRAYGFYPSVDQWRQRDFVSLPNRPGVVEFD